MQGRENWSFHKSPDGWIWLYVDPLTGEKKRPASPFDSFLDCVEDAARNGYLRPRFM